MACDAVNNRWGKSDNRPGNGGYLLIELAYARFDADYQDGADDFSL